MWLPIYPQMYFEKNGYEPDDNYSLTPKSKLIVKPLSCIAPELMPASHTNCYHNNFAIGLNKYFPEPMVWDITEVLRLYCQKKQNYFLASQPIRASTDR